MKRDTEKILIEHGNGGEFSYQLLKEKVLPFFSISGDILIEGHDSAVVEISGSKIAFTTDTFTVKPIMFPGGDIGRLCVAGTVNDLSMTGARPLYLSLGLIIEEGFPMNLLEQILRSIRDTAREANVSIITGDTKVVPKGESDQIFINTSGIGVIEHNHRISGDNAKPGDLIIVNGNIGDHGLTILTVREQLEFHGNLKSDTAPLNKIIEKLVSDPNIKEIHVLRDPTRGGVASTLNEIARESNVGIELWEEEIPLSPEVQGASELLGVDPLYLANEGKFILFIPSKEAEPALKVIKNDPLGKDAKVIGEVKDTYHKKVWMRTIGGGYRIIDMLQSEPLPRIC